MATIIRTAQSEEEIPTADQIAVYVESLKLYRQQNPNLDGEFVHLIDNLPTPRKIRQDFSFEEVKILFETVGYLWRKITGNDLGGEVKTKWGELPFLGNYWIIKDGIVLPGLNHYSIVKQNANMFSNLLNINGFALQHYLVGQPNRLIQFIIKNGGVRMLARKDQKAFFQMSECTYAEWGKLKVKKLDFREKVVKIIDFKVPYKGWNSGIPIKL
jgi:hypothetical protein